MSMVCRRIRVLGVTAVLALAILGAATSCGGGGGGPRGETLTLIHFSHQAIDNVPINPVLKFIFSEALDEASVTRGSIQIREGDAFGATVEGEFEVAGVEARFWPDLPGVCDLSDPDYRGFQPGTRYRIAVVGAPESFAVRSLETQQPLTSTSTFEFTTLPESDPEYLQDQIAGQPPALLTSSPANGDAAVAVADGNEVRITFTENLDPCQVDTNTVRFFMYEIGDPNTFDAVGSRSTGFRPAADNSTDPYSWGSTIAHTKLNPPQRIPCTVHLEQDFERTDVIVQPIGGRFPENSLLVVELTFDILDFGGAAMERTPIAFTTENQPLHERQRILEFEGETPMQPEQTTADVDTARSPSKAQGWFVFAGDGDNGSDRDVPAAPLPCIGQVNDGALDDFEPNADVTFHTGSTVNVCDNDVDGSVSVVWEFNSFRIRNGITVRFIGENTAFILVRGDVMIDPGGTLLVRGTQRSGTPPVGDGEDWGWIGIGSAAPVTSAGGTGVAGGGDGGLSQYGLSDYGQDGVPGAGSPDVGLSGGTGAGLGGVAVSKELVNNGGTGGGGGGGGHATAGTDGVSGTSPYATLKAAEKSDGGERYWAGTHADRMLLPSAGSGAGGGGWLDPVWAGGASNAMSGGGGGAGGGYVAIASAGNVTILGTIDASGGDGGGGVGLWNGASYLARSGGGGGGSGGGILLLTPNDMRLGSTANIIATGGAGGSTSTTVPGPYGVGGGGGAGRIVLEDGDSVIQGLAGATVSPGDGSKGFYRGIFDATRFRGSKQGVALSDPFFVGSFAPTYVAPANADFIAGSPSAGGPGLGSTAVLVEIRGYPILRNGTPDLTQPTPWYTAGYYEDSGQPSLPIWHAGVEPGDIPRAPDSAGPDMTNLNLAAGGSSYLQVRLTFVLADQLAASDPGPFIDRWSLRYEEDL